MTDKDIKKALECCSIDNHIGVCKECPFTDVCDNDEQALQKYALDLINRNEEMINGLIAGQETLQKGMAEKNKEIMRLQGIILAFMDEVAKLEDDGIDVSRFPLIPICDEGRNAIDKFSALARKEFAEKIYRFLCIEKNWRTLKESWLINGECDWLKQNIDNLLKEMEGETDGKQ